MSRRDSNDEITFRELAQLFRSYVLEIRRRWRIILILFLIIGCGMLLHAVTTKVTYVAEMTFMVNEEKSGVSGGIGSILGDFGFGSGTEQNLQKILKIAKSRTIFGMVIFDSLRNSNSDTFLANDVFNELKEYHKMTHKPLYKFWQKESALINFEFRHNDMTKFERLENAAYLQMFGKLSRILTTKTDEETGIMEISIATHSEELSYKLCHQFYNKLSEYYINKVVEKQRETYQLINHKVDSIRGIIQEKEYAIARYDDSYRNIWKSETKVPISALKRDVQMSYIMLGEAIKNKELADFSLKNRTPFIQIIDEPIKPLNALKPSWIKAIINAFIIAVLLGICYIILSKWVRDIL